MKKLIEELRRQIDHECRTETQTLVGQVYRNALAAAEAGNKERVKVELGFLLNADDRLEGRYNRLVALIDK